MKRFYLLSLMLICLAWSSLAQERELAAIDANALPQTFVNHTGTFAFDYPQNWVVEEIAFGAANYAVHPAIPAGVEDYSEADGIIGNVSVMGSGIDPVRWFEYGEEHTDIDYEIAEVFINGRYAVIATTEYRGDDFPPNDGVQILIALYDEFYAYVGLHSPPEFSQNLLGFAIDMAASIRLIDPTVIETDTSSLTASYSNEVFLFRYPEDYLLRETETITIAESRDFSQVPIYSGHGFDASLWQLALAVGGGNYDGHFRLALHLRSRESLVELEMSESWFEVELFQQLYAEHSGDMTFFAEYLSEYNGRPIFWSEDSYIFEEYEQWVHIIHLIYELSDETYLIIQGHSYGLYELYPLRLFMLNVLTSFELL